MISIAETDGSLRTVTKSTLATSLTNPLVCPQTIVIPLVSYCLLIDGMALVCSICKPDKAQTFGDFADVFAAVIFQTDKPYGRIDVIFDRYRETSIKSAERQRRCKTKKTIRHCGKGRNVPQIVPTSFLVSCWHKHPPIRRLLLQGGFTDERQVRSATTNLSHLNATHEEADTRMVLHCIHNNSETIVVSARDTDVLLLLVAHCDHVQSNNLWLMAGTAKIRKYQGDFIIREIYDILSKNTVPALLPYHSLKGCDTTSYFFGKSNRQQGANLLACWPH